MRQLVYNMFITNNHNSSENIMTKILVVFVILIFLLLRAHYFITFINCSSNLTFQNANNFLQVEKFSINLFLSENGGLRILNQRTL